MLVVWLALVLCLGFIVASNTGTEHSGGLFAFLFPRPQEPAPLPPPAIVQKAPKADLPPVITPPAAELPRPHAEEWLALSMGKKAGSGTLGSPEITVLDNGDVEVRFACHNAPGNYHAFYPSNVRSLSIDLMGAWGKGIRADKFTGKGVLKRVQIADHRQWLRVSGVARELSGRLMARVEYAPTLKALRIVFSKQQ